MSDEKDIENINSLNDAEDTNDTSVEGDDDDPKENPDFKEYWEEKVKKLEETNKKLYARIKQSSTNKPLGQAVSPSGVEEKLERLELRTKGYSDSEIDFLKPYGGEKALENPYVKQALEIMRDKAKAENAVVDTDGGKSDIEKKYTDEQLRNLPTDELEKLLPKA